MKRAQNTIDPPGPFILSFGLSYHMILAFICEFGGLSRYIVLRFAKLADRRGVAGQAGGAALWQRNNAERRAQCAHSCPITPAHSLIHL